jgi:hypothetical protein
LKRHLFSAVLLLAFYAGPTAACNPDPPLPPILEGHAYDRMAMEYLIRDAVTIGIARYVGRVDIFMEEKSADPETRARYIFDLREGWKNPLPARLVVPGYWLSCELPLREGGSYLVYLDGAVLLYILPAERAATELGTLGDLDWFYSQTGELRRPELVNEVGEGGAVDEAEQREEARTR